MMKTNLIRVASLSLALLPFSASAQEGQPPSASSATVTAGNKPATVYTRKPSREERVEVHVDNNPLADSQFSSSQSSSANFNQNVDHVFNFTGVADAGETPLVVATSGLDEKAITNLEEDLTVMARILDKSLDKGGSDDRRAMGIHLWALGQGGRGARNMYLEGHGALFQLNVSMPLIGPSSKEKEKEKNDDGNESSSAWDSARREVYGGKDDGGPRNRETRNSTVKFDGKRVEALKENLIEALKNASHIRGLGADEYVTVVVQAPSLGRGPVVRRVGRGFGGEAGASNRGQTFDWKLGGGSGGMVAGNANLLAVAGGEAGPGGARSVLVLRAKKSDIDAAAKGKYDDEKFRKVVSVRTYQTGARRGDDDGERP